MAHDPITPEKHKARYAEAIRRAREEGEGSFQHWFNKAGGVEQAVVRGHWDFAHHILTPAVLRAMVTPEDKCALEIGFGGGRLLNAACSFFKAGVGVDIHGEGEATAAFLRGCGKDNFTLHRTDGASLDMVPPESIDFVYSFIVLQHLRAFADFTSYLHETRRVLKKGGLAQLYFGAWHLLSWRQRLRHFRQGYVELTHVPVNNISLVIRMGRAQAAARQAGFKILATGRSYKRMPDGYPHTFGGQSGMTLLKP